MFHSRRVLLLAKNAFDRAGLSHDESEVSIAMSAAAFEGFMNELGHFAEISSRDDKCAALSELLYEAEEAKLGAVAKYRFAIFILSGRFPKRGEALIQRITALVKLRNGLLHVKPEKIFSFDQPVGSGHGQSLPAPLSQLLTDQAISLPRRLATWRQVVGVPGVAKWAYNVSIEGIKSIYAATSDEPLRQLLGLHTQDLVGIP